MCYQKSLQSTIAYDKGTNFSRLNAYIPNLISETRETMTHSI